MKHALAFLLAVLVGVTLSACAEGNVTGLPTAPSAPSAPTPPAATPSTQLTSLWLMVIDDTGGCIEGATLVVVRGQARELQLTQETPCGYWDYWGGATFKDVLLGGEMTVRASAPGYADTEVTVVPRGSSRIVFLTPSRL